MVCLDQRYKGYLVKSFPADRMTANPESEGDELLEAQKTQDFIDFLVKPPPPRMSGVPTRMLRMLCLFTGILTTAEESRVQFSLPSSRKRMPYSVS